MIEQSKPGIYIYQSDDDKCMRYYHYPTLNKFFQYEYFNTAYNELERFSDEINRKFIRIEVSEYSHVYPKYVCNHHGKILTLDHLVGEQRKYYAKRANNRNFRRRKTAYTHYRQINTFQERKMSLAIDEEYRKQIKCRRNANNLWSSWDDPKTHNDKCWKTQSKRKHQWK